MILVDEFRGVMKKIGWELTEPKEREAIWEGFYYDDHGRLRYIPERTEQREEYHRRDKFANAQAEKFPREKREYVVKKLRKYRADNLKDADIRFDTEEKNPP